MSNRKKRTTKEDSKTANEIDIPKQYDLDIIIGESWKAVFHDILNKRHSEGWKYIPPYYRIKADTSIADSQGNHPIHYGVLYERILQLKMSPGRVVIGPEKPILRNQPCDNPPSKDSFTMIE